MGWLQQSSVFGFINAKVNTDLHLSVFIYLFIYLFIIHISIYYQFISITADHNPSFFIFLFTSLCAYVHSKSTVSKSSVRSAVFSFIQSRMLESLAGCLTELWASDFY